MCARSCGMSHSRSSIRSLLQLGAAQGLAEGEEKDPLYNDAVDIMIESGRGSVSLIQRRLNIGYSRASRLDRPDASPGDCRRVQGIDGVRSHAEQGRMGADESG